MNKTNRRMRYLEIQRQQLRRELDGMGYGLRNGYSPGYNRMNRADSMPTLLGIGTLLALGLFGSLV